MLPGPTPGAAVPESRTQSYPSAEDVTVFPHPDNTRYYFGGQANSIGQVNAALSLAIRGTEQLPARG